MRGGLMKHWTREQHTLILSQHQDDGDAAEFYNRAGIAKVTRQNVWYWRSIFVLNEGNQPAADAALRNAPNARKLRTPNPDDDIGDNFIQDEPYRCILHIPDIHAPYQHKDTIEFLRAVKNAFPIDLVVCAGDEVDYHALSFHDSDPNLDSAGVELEKAKAFLLSFEAEFPSMFICSSNHGSMAFRKAKHHGIPVQLIRSYREVLFPHGRGGGWSWKDEWIVPTPLGDVMFKHSSSNILSDAAHNRCNLMVGHSHSKYSVEYCASRDYLYWGAYGGCLIDNDSYAFAYGKLSKDKPIIGCTIIMEGRPMLVPMLLNSEGRWVGKL